MPDGERVFVTCEGRSTTGHRFRNTEILTIRGAQVVEAEVHLGSGGRSTAEHEAAPHPL
ncbi:hypothetical protein [Ramlibacter montanisoli]|uniref:Uncharacterized protein n=1 Tax=Ramlibacter montanisoli TaxID=2732512 RepID=A0A849K6A2_9BURK|nr:hypothetical protein [Ramlibacter montanisoli]NNU43952.1 hypothetical protein [Ramlibacter montanisoli]